MRYFSLLYAPEARRAALAALYVIEAEIRDSAHAASHDVAHTRLQWWRGEVDRLINGSPQHPATRALLAATKHRRADFAKLHELLAAADMDVACMTYTNAREVRAYSSRSGGALAELIAMQLIAQPALDESLRAQAHRIGVGVRQVEIVRDLRQDAHHGRLYLPLDLLDTHQLTLNDLRGAQLAPRARQALRRFGEETRADLELPQAAPETLRPLFVLAALHRRLLDRIAHRDYDVAAQRIELGALEKPWTAWRAARQVGR